MKPIIRIGVKLYEKEKMIEMMKRQTIAIDKLGEALIIAIKTEIASLPLYIGK